MGCHAGSLEEKDEMEMNQGTAPLPTSKNEKTDASKRKKGDTEKRKENKVRGCGVEVVESRVQLSERVDMRH